MAEDLVTLRIDEREVAVPKGTVIVDAAKQAGIDIPVFCYHPKLKPVGMCRMCLVRVGTPKVDPATKQMALDANGKPAINWMPKLQTGCTTPVSPGMAVITKAPEVIEAQQEIVEFLLTSHPLDCPICDKGGECPLQNLTMRHGPGKSRFWYDDKLHLDKHVPLGELIFLDRERCIQCARCIRFQDEVAGDHVLDFYERGRSLEIITISDPPFDSKFSGNTTDICPVGALTTADFRFKARPWELNNVATLCPHCPVGCNMTASTRVGQIKRIMPRQNEQVNEIWICDKGRFAHHFTESRERLRKPLRRKGDGFVETSWEEALDLVARELQAAAPAVGGIASDRLANEDLYLFQALIRQGLKSNHVDQYPGVMAGGEVIAEVGIGAGTNFGKMGKGTAIVVIASDLEEEAPIWYLRIKQAADRGATLIVANPRPTKLDRYARHKVRYRYGSEAQVALRLAAEILNNDRHAANFIAGRVDGLDDLTSRLEEYDRATTGEASGVPAESLRTIAEAENVVVAYGNEGLSRIGSQALAQAAANLLLLTGHVGRPNNGLLAVWPHNNTQGAWDMGVRPNLLPGYRPVAAPGLNASEMLAAALRGELRGLYLAGADPAGDSPALAEALRQLDFLVVQDLFLTETAKLAHVVLPAQSFAEREGTYTSGERRVQRFYQAQPPVGESWPDWKAFARIGERLGLNLPKGSPAAIMAAITGDVPLYRDMTYPALAEVVDQWPDVGGEGLYFGGTAYSNLSGLGKQWASRADTPTARLSFGWVQPEVPAQPQSGMEMRIVPIAVLFDAGTMVRPSDLLHHRVPGAHIRLNPADARRMNLTQGMMVTVSVQTPAGEEDLPVVMDPAVPLGVGLVPQSLNGYNWQGLAIGRVMLRTAEMVTG